MLICYLYTFFGEVSGKGFGTFFNLVVLLLLSFKSSLYILDNSPFSAMSFANLFSLDSVFCRADVLILMKSSLSIFLWIMTVLLLFPRSTGNLSPRFTVLVFYV